MLDKKNRRNEEGLSVCPKGREKRKKYLIRRGDIKKGCLYL